MQPDVQVAGLFTTLDEASERVPIHHVRKSLLEEQARAAGIRLHCIDIPGDCPNEVYEERLNLFLKTMKDVTHLAFGDLFLEDIRRYRERQFAASGLGLLFPLWGSPTPALAREMTRAGVRAVITCVDTSVAPREWAGRLFDSAFVEAIPPGIDPCGENGEFHTFVCEGPMLAAPLRVRPGAIAGDGRFIYSDLAVH